MDSARSTPTGARYTMARAEQHGRLHVWQNTKGVTADCEAHATGKRCCSFATYRTLDALDQAFIEHAAEVEGVCWACSEPTEDWPNRHGCDRCWLMWNAHNGVLPRDAGPRPSGSTGGES